MRLITALALMTAVFFPTARIVDAYSEDIPLLIDTAADRRGLTRRFLRCLAWEESSWRPWVTSPWGDQGILQFQRRTFNANAPRYGWQGYTPYHAEASLDVGAGMIAEISVAERFRQWPPSRRCGDPRR